MYVVEQLWMNVVDTANNFLGLLIFVQLDGDGMAKFSFLLSARNL